MKQFLKLIFLSNMNFIYTKSKKNSSLNGTFMQNEISLKMIDQVSPFNHLCNHLLFPRDLPVKLGYLINITLLF